MFGPLLLPLQLDCPAQSRLQGHLPAFRLLEFVFDDEDSLVLFLDELFLGMAVLGMEGELVFGVVVLGLEFLDLSGRRGTLTL